MSETRRDRLEFLPIDELVMLRRNPQYLTPHQMEALKTSIRRDGFLAPVLVRPQRDGKYGIVSGNHRVMAARELGMTHVPCLIADLDDRQSKRVAVNMNTVHGAPPADLLAPFLAEMDDELLATIHLERETIEALTRFDDELAAALARLNAPPSVDHDSPIRSIAACTCPICGKGHMRPEKPDEQM